MFEKLCVSCQKHSYSSARTGIWNCPYCQKDITHVKAKEANHRRVQFQALQSYKKIHKFAYHPR